MPSLVTTGRPLLIALNLILIVLTNICQKCILFLFARQAPFYGIFLVGRKGKRKVYSHARRGPMRNISQLAASMMLLATQVNVPASVGAAAAADTSVQPTQSVLEVRINTNTGDPVHVTAPNKPDFDAEILVPLRAAQAKAQAARVAAQQAAARKTRVTVRTAAVSVVLPAGSHTDWMRAAGIAEGDFGYIDYIIDRESGWGVTKSNYGGSGAYGLGQALPASKMAPYGADYLTNPVTQLRWATSYAVGRYGSWANAYAFWTTRHYW